MGQPAGSSAGRSLMVQTPMGVQNAGLSLSPSSTLISTARWLALYVWNFFLRVKGSGVFLGMRILLNFLPVAGSVARMPRLCELTLVTENCGDSASASLGASRAA